MADSEPKTVIVDSFAPWERRLEKHGWPTLLLILVGLFFWRFSDWFQPKIDEAIRKHFFFIEETVRTQEKQAENGEMLMRQQEKIGDILSRQQDQIKDIHQAVVKPK